MEEGREAGARAYRGELVAGVADEHAGLPHSAVPHRDALDEPGHAGCHIQGPRWKKEISRARQRTRGEARSLFFCCLLWLWLLVEEERRKSDREGSHAFSLLSQVPLTGSHSCLRGHLFPSLFFYLVVLVLLLFQTMAYWDLDPLQSFSEWGLLSWD